MPFDLRPLFQALYTLWISVQVVTEYRGNVLVAVNHYVGPQIALGVFFLAGLSEGYGTRAVTLFLNRLGRRPFFISLVLTGLTYVAGAVIWAVTINVVGALFFTERGSLAVVLQAVGVGYLPLLFAFMAFAPYVGPALLVLLQALSLLFTTLAVSLGFQIPLWEGAACTIGGWLILQGLRWFTAGPTTAISRRLLRLISGHEVSYNLRDVVPALPLGLRAHSAALGEGEGEIE